MNSEFVYPCLLYTPFCWRFVKPRASYGSDSSISYGYCNEVSLNKLRRRRIVVKSFEIV